ncbi:hypothetical protein K466DRAFT_508657 [Polyporus arcularius HHB13444]|uniref:Uncharacterized protein n=1 Tax=Polyporus arcularius HHB13444 TaxID=1314778 RepID=A0A5C3Q3D1_9APHY|nr:hypothetical protein K466DRAFT_508657 [Polyporus arcularius HHB13444]
MLATTLRATRAFPASSRLLHASSVAAAQAAGKDPRLSQGSVSQPGHNHPGDPHDQVARQGQDIAHGRRQAASGYDAASPEGDMKTDRTGLSGNQEGVGFADQVGSASPSGGKGKQGRPSAGEGMGAQEEITPPGLVASIKSKLGLGTSTDEAKQNRGGGVGVTGTGALPFEKTPGEGRRPYHTSAVRFSEPTRGQAPEASRQPKEHTHSDQNSHLKHKSSPDSPDTGKGNAAEDPKLPSHQMSDKSGTSQQRRTFTTSARRFDSKHTAESYFKDIDNSAPSSQKVHQVDSSATGSDVQRPSEPLTGQWSRAGAQTKEYETTSKTDTYDLKPSSGPEKEEKLGYGNTKGTSASHSHDESISKPDEGPEGDNKGGRKPEGR